jgi:hypothetical protein
MHHQMSDSSVLRDVIQCNGEMLLPIGHTFINPEEITDAREVTLQQRMAHMNQLAQRKS